MIFRTRDYASSPGCSESGSGLLSALIAVGLVGGLALTANTVTSGLFRATKSAGDYSDLILLRSMIFEAIDIKSTLSDFGIDENTYNSLCPSTSSNQTGPFIRLRRRTLDASKPATYFTGPLLTAGLSSGAAKWGDFFVRASCSYEEESMVIRVAKIDANGQFGKDPLTGKVLDWNSDRGLLFGKGKEFPLTMASGDYTPGAHYGYCAQYVRLTEGTINNRSAPSVVVPPATSTGIDCACEQGFTRALSASVIGAALGGSGGYPQSNGTVTYTCVRDLRPPAPPPGSR